MDALRFGVTPPAAHYLVSSVCSAAVLPVRNAGSNPGRRRLDNNPALAGRPRELLGVDVQHVAAHRQLTFNCPSAPQCVGYLCPLAGASALPPKAR